MTNELSTERAIEALYTVRAYYASLTAGYPKGKDCKGIGDVMCSEIANSCLMAIKALEQEEARELETHPYFKRCDSCIHSEEQDGYSCYECVKNMADNFEAQPTSDDDIIKALKAVRTIHNGNYAPQIDEAIRRLEAQPSEDCISRQAVIDKATSWNTHFTDSERYVSLSDIMALPSITPQRPKGKWIDVLEYRNEFGSAWHYECSECRARSYKGFKPLEKYCPNCGSYNGGEEECSSTVVKSED